MRPQAQRWLRYPTADADLITVNGQQYLQSGDVYYQALYSGNGLVYKVAEIPQGQQQ